MTNPDPNTWLMGGGISAKFESPGDTVGGRIVAEPEMRQQTDFTTGKPLFWDSGERKLHLVVQVATELRDPQAEGDDGIRCLYVKGNMQKAIRDAIRKAGAPGLEVGGYLSVTYTGDGQPAQRNLNPPKLYEATYRAPSGMDEFLGTTPAAQQPTATAYPAQNTPQSQQQQPDIPALTPVQIAALKAIGVDPATQLRQ